MTLEVVVFAEVAARLDMMFPSLKADNPNIRRRPGFRYCQNGSPLPMQRRPASPIWRSKGCEPGFPGSREAQSYDAGIRTVSITWITPFDWLTFEIVSMEVPPLAA